MKPRILLADDHRMITDAIKALLEPDFTVLATVVDGRTLVAKALELRPDVILMDISMPLLNGLDAGRQLIAQLPNTKLIYLTMNQDQDIVAEALKIGATGFLIKSCEIAELLVGIRTVLKGKHYITPLVTGDRINPFLDIPLRGEKPIHITPRQREVLQLLAEGRSMKEVASVLDVSTRTVAFHKYRMMEDLNLKTNAELIQYAVRRHIV
jgi:DNA-binding NarL/FixJ family response regulator